MDQRKKKKKSQNYCLVVNLLERGLFIGKIKKTKKKKKRKKSMNYCLVVNLLERGSQMF